MWRRPSMHSWRPGWRMALPLSGIVFLLAVVLYPMRSTPGVPLDVRYKQAESRYNERMRHERALVSNGCADEGIAEAHRETKEAWEDLMRLNQERATQYNSW